MKAWYTDALRFHSPVRWTSRSDEGTLEVFPQRIVFSKDDTKLEIDSVKAVSIVNRPVPWLSLIVDNAAILLLVLFKVTSYFTLDKLPELVLLMSIINVVFVFMLRRIKWVEVDYSDDAGKPQCAYFTDGSSFGIARALGGADELYHAIEVGLRSANATTAETQYTSSGEAAAPANQEGGCWVSCENCGNRSFFSAQHRGHVHNCPHCGAYMDV
jgi:hypothetical protein